MTNHRLVVNLFVSLFLGIIGSVVLIAAGMGLALKRPIEGQCGYGNVVVEKITEGDVSTCDGSNITIHLLYISRVFMADEWSMNWAPNLTLVTTNEGRLGPTIDYWRNQTWPCYYYEGRKEIIDGTPSGQSFGAIVLGGILIFCSMVAMIGAISAFVGQKKRAPHAQIRGNNGDL